MNTACVSSLGFWNLSIGLWQKKEFFFFFLSWLCLMFCCIRLVLIAESFAFLVLFFFFQKNIALLSRLVVWNLSTELWHKRGFQVVSVVELSCFWCFVIWVGFWLFEVLICLALFVCVLFSFFLFLFKKNVAFVSQLVLRNLSTGL